MTLTNDSVRGVGMVVCQ